MNRGNLDTLLFQFARQSRCTDLGIRKNQHLLQVAAADQMGDHVALGFFFGFIDNLRDLIRSGVAACDFDQDRIILETGCQFFDLWRKRRREHQVLALLGQQINDALQIRQKAHVEHAVGFVHDQYLGLRQVQRFLLYVIKQAAWGSDDDFDAVTQGCRLRRHIDTAKHDRCAQWRVARVGLHVLCDLIGQLAGRRQDQCAHRMPGRRCATVGMCQQQLNDGQRKTGGLASAGLGSTHHVATLQHDRNSLRLNRRWMDIALIGKGLQDGWRQAEFVKTGKRCSWSVDLCGGGRVF